MPPPMPDYAQDLLIGRQPIINAQQELVGYALSFRECGHASAERSPGSAMSATAGVVCAAFAELGLGDALGSQQAFICADEDFVGDDVVEFLPAGQVVLELDFRLPVSPERVARCAQLRERGYRLALARYDGSDPATAALLPLIDIVRIDSQASDEQLAGLLAQLAGRPLQLLADRVDTREAMERCRDLGFALFQGYYFARPQIVSGRRLSSSQLTLIRLINLVAREADSSEIEENFKREPALTVNLLRLVNAVGFGVVQKVDSLRHALNILGRKQLLRWLQLLLMASSGNSAQPERDPLLQIAAQRGRLMENLAERCEPARHGIGDEAFLAGIMSLMPAALGLPIKDILEQIPVADSLQQALALREGELGRLLALTEHLDDNDWGGCDSLLATLPALSPAVVSNSLSEALAWLHRDSESA